MQFKPRTFKLQFYYHPFKAFLRGILIPPSPKHWDYLGYRNYYDLNCLSVYGDTLASSGYELPRSYRGSLFLRAKIDLPNDPGDIIGHYGFNQKKIVDLSKVKSLPPALVLGTSRYMWFEDKLISVAAALYRGDKTADLFVPCCGKFVSNSANMTNLSNFT